jgi:CheY-like chemotaxis protein
MEKFAKILVVDDDADFIFAVTTILKANACEVVTAKNPLEGLSKLVSEKPDIILLDIMMDNLFDGYSTCHKIKTAEEFREFKNIPIILVSVVKEITGSRFSFNPKQMGFEPPDDYLDKPVRAEVLMNAIKKLVDKNKLVQN